MKTRKFCPKVLLLISILSLSSNAFPQDIPDPESYFGFKPGADYKMIRWDKMVSYFNTLDEKSPWMVVQNLGKTTLGNPFLLTIISSPENLSRLDKYMMPTSLVVIPIVPVLCLTSVPGGNKPLSLEVPVSQLRMIARISALLSGFSIC